MEEEKKREEIKGNENPSQSSLGIRAWNVSFRLNHQDIGFDPTFIPGDESPDGDKSQDGGLSPSLSLLKAIYNYFIRFRTDSKGFFNWNDKRFVLFTDGEIEGDKKR